MSKFRKEKRRFWCCDKSNDFDFSTNMRWKSWIVNQNFEIDFRNNENVANEINEQFDAISKKFDVIFTFLNMILYVKSEKRDRFDENICFDVAKMTNEINKFLVCFESVTNLKFENFEVVLNEIDEIDEIVVIEMLFLSFFLLKFRFETTLFIFFVAWCWRMYSWNLFFESKTFSQCLQTTFLQIDWLCCNKRINDEKKTKQWKQKWYWDEKRETNEFDVKISNFEKEFVENFVKNAMIKIFNYSFKFLTISFCFWYQINAKSRKQMWNNWIKSISR